MSGDEKRMKILSTEKPNQLIMPATSERSECTNI